MTESQDWATAQRVLGELCRPSGDGEGNFVAVVRGDRWPEVVRLRHLWWETLSTDCGWSAGRIAAATEFSKATVRTVLRQAEAVG